MPAARRIESGGGQDPVDRSLADAAAEAEEFAWNAPVPPARGAASRSVQAIDETKERERQG